MFSQSVLSPRMFGCHLTVWCWEGLGAGEEGDDRGWDGWMVSLTRWMWVWVNSGSWWWTGRPGVLQFMGLRRVGHDWATELNWTELTVIVILTLGSGFSFQTSSHGEKPRNLRLCFPSWLPSSVLIEQLLLSSWKFDNDKPLWPVVVGQRLSRGWLIMAMAWFLTLNYNLRLNSVLWWLWVLT